MKTAFRLMVLVFALGGWVVAALSIHVVRTPSSLTILTKERFHPIQGWSDIYVDTSIWTLNEVSAHPGLVGRMIATGKAGQLAHIGTESDLRQAMARGPADADTQPTTASSSKDGGVVNTLAGVERNLRQTISRLDF